MGRYFDFFFSPLQYGGGGGSSFTGGEPSFTSGETDLDFGGSYNAGGGGDEESWD